MTRGYYAKNVPFTWGAHDGRAALNLFRVVQPVSQSFNHQTEQCIRSRIRRYFSIGLPGKALHVPSRTTSSTANHGRWLRHLRS